MQLTKIIIFDFDQTLVETSQRHYEVYKYLADKYELEILEYETYWAKRKKGYSNRDVMGEQCLDDKNLNDVENEWETLIEQDEYLRFDKPYEYSENYLQLLSVKYLLWLVSLRSNENGLFKELKWLKWHKYFEKIIPVKHSRDNIDGKVLGVKRAFEPNINFVAWFGDGNVDREAAHILSIPFIHVEDVNFHKNTKRLISTD